MKKLAITIATATALLIGLGVPTTAAQGTARALLQVAEGCNGEEVQMTPGVMPPYRISKRAIHFGYTEWHFPPSCRDQLRREYVKVKKGKDPKVYSTMGDRYSKRFKKGTYRVKVRYEYRYWNAQTKTYSAWHGLSVTKTLRLR